MRLPAPKSATRAGMSLLEVLVALAIFLISIVAIGRLMTNGSDRAFEIRYRIHAAQICRSKMAEVMAGIVALQSQGDGPVDEDSDWNWSMDCSEGATTGLWNVKITVSRQFDGNQKIQSTLEQVVIDPSIRGSTMDAQQATGSSTSSSSSSTTSPMP